MGSDAIETSPNGLLVFSLKLGAVEPSNGIDVFQSLKLRSFLCRKRCQLLFVVTLVMLREELPSGNLRLRKLLCSWIVGLATKCLL